MLHSSPVCSRCRDLPPALVGLFLASMLRRKLGAFRNRTLRETMAPGLYAGIHGSLRGYTLNSRFGLAIASSYQMRPILTLLVLSLNASAATPFIDVLSPPSANPGSAPVSLTIRGASFEPSSTVRFGAQILTPSSVTPNRIDVIIPAASLVQSRTFSVAVGNPPQSGRVTLSNAIDFSVLNPISAVGVHKESDGSLSGSFPAVLLPADFDGDGKLDIAAIASGFYRGNGTGNFAFRPPVS